MWAWQVRMTTTTMLVRTTTSLVVMLLLLPRGGLSMPTDKANDRPIIGILAQEIHGSLADALSKILENESGSLRGLAPLIPERSGRVQRDTDGTHRNPPTEPLEELPQTEQESAVELSGTTAVEPDRGGVAPDPTGASQEIQFISALEGPHGEILEVVEDVSPALEVVPTTPPPHPPVPKNASYISASYVKFVEGGGARVVPIFVNREREYYEQILKSINGVLFPGGAVAVDETSAFGRAGKIIYEISKNMNDAGDVFPIWGTCLGFEMMMGLAANGQEIRARCDAQNTANRLKLDADYADGYLLRHLPKRLIKALTSKQITSNFHMYCLTPKNFTAFGVDKTYRALAYSADRRGVEYIAMAEAWDYPFFAVQFHPEKSPYEWTTIPGHNHIPHSSVAIDTANHFAQVYVDYARRSKHRFASQSEEASSLIYNYYPVYTGQYSPMEQIYIF